MRPAEQYEFRARSRNAAGWGAYGGPIFVRTSELPLDEQPLSPVEAVAAAVSEEVDERSEAAAAVPEEGHGGDAEDEDGAANAAAVPEQGDGGGLEGDAEDKDDADPIPMVAIASGVGAVVAVAAAAYLLKSS